MREASYKAKRLAKLLEAALTPFYPQWKLTIDPEEIYPATGWYRTSPQADCLRWEATIRLNGCPMGEATSWHTMTECCKGLTISRDTAGGAGANDWSASPTSENNRIDSSPQTKG